MGSVHPRDYPLDRRLQELKVVQYPSIEDYGQGLAKSSSTYYCNKINDSVYELHTSTKPTMDIIFFHGLQLGCSSEAHLSTWRSRSGDAAVWPKQWLSEDHPSLRVLTVSYDASMKKDKRNGRMDLYLVAESSLHGLLLAGVGRARPVILVGHSFGGLVIKQLCLQAHKAASLRNQDTPQQTALFLDNIRGIFYYGTPHRGSQFTDVVEKFSIDKGELVEYAKAFSKNLSRLNEDFDRLCDKYSKWQVAGVGETLPTDLANGICDVIVQEASARCKNFTLVPEDHFSLCQPRGRDSTSYKSLVGFIHDVQVTVLSPTNEQALPSIPVGQLISIMEAGGEIRRRLKDHSALGFWGMGGIGKTTLCKAVFNSLRTTFEYTLFVEGVKLIPGDGKEFEEELLSCLHFEGKKMTKTPNLSQLSNKMLLVAFDDVEKGRDTDVLKNLRRTCRGSSRFILTSRDRQTLYQMDDISIYDVETLDYESSQTLFRNHAFSDPAKALPEWQKKCMKDIVEKCGGLPLTLEVVGKYLKTCKDKDVWEQTLEALVEADHGKDIGLDEVWKKLKISYDRLEDVQKQMFVEAATLFQERIVELQGWRHGQRAWTLREAKVAWNVMYGNEALRWRTLVDRSLVSDVAEDSEIRMHEHLRHLGEMLAKTAKDNMRIRSGSVEDLSKVLHDGKCKLERVHSLQVVCEPITKQCWKCGWLRSGWSTECAHHFPHLPAANIQHMERLRYLQLVNCEVAERKVILPPDVVIFSSQNSGENISFAATSRLVYLSMKAFEKQRLPESLCELNFLQSLYLEARNLKTLPDSFGGLKKLRQLKLIGQNLKRLPDSFGELEVLQKLHLECGNLKCLPESFGRLKHLQELNLGCEILVSLPHSFGELEALQDFSVQCGGLEKLPDSFGKLGALRKLELKSDQLRCLPESFGDLKHLQELNLGCGILERLPNSFGELEALQDLSLQFASLGGLPDSFGDLRALQKLELKRLCSEMGDTGSGRVEYLKLVVFTGIFSSGMFDTFVLYSGNPDLTECWEYNDLLV